jgi:6-phosphogluconolactonase (cycloisomerase 2 family)
MPRTHTGLRQALALAASAGLITVGSVALATSASAAPHRDGDGGRAVFVLDDDPAGNGVIAFSRAADGTLTRGSTYATGGLGIRQSGAAADPLASQGALTFDRERGLLYAVNGGSNTITVFAVDGAHLHRLQVISSGGTLPSSIALRGDVVYVLNAGGDASIAGFRVEGRRLHPITGSVRSLGLGNPANPNFLKSPAQVALTPDGRHVVVTTKTGGTVIVWNLAGNDRPFGTATVTTVGAVPFALDFDRHGHLLLVNAAGTLSSWSVQDDGSLTVVAAPVAEFGTAACWITTSGRYAYVANAGSGTVSGFSISRDGTLTLLSPVDGVSATTGPGPIDLDASHGVLYVENGGNGSISSFRIGADGSLSPIETVTGLTVGATTGAEGLVAS